MHRPSPARAIRALTTLLVALALAACADGAGSAGASPSTAATRAPSATAEASASASAEASDAEASDAEGARQQVAIEGSRYEPAELTVAAGTEVVFENRDGFDHSVTEGTGGQAADDAVVDEEISADETLSVRFDDPGTVEITCIFHPTMEMTITVED